MRKTILITSATDGLGLEATRQWVGMGHHVLLHARSPEALDATVRALSPSSGGGRVERYAADLSRMSEVVALADAIGDDHDTLDVLVNNANVHFAHDEITKDGLDVRFAVNTIAPWLLTRRLLPRLGASGRVVNLCTTNQAPVDPKALTGVIRLADGAAYAQSKLALMVWSRALALALGKDGPAIIAVDPGVMTAVNAVRDVSAVSDDALHAGARILVRAALEDDVAKACGRCFDSETDRFAAPHPDALDIRKTKRIVRLIEAMTLTVRLSRVASGAFPLGSDAASGAW